MIKTVGQLKSWEFLKFWDWYFESDLVGVFSNGTCLPGPKAVFRALELTPFDKVKVVILGQDPYPTKGHANGLAFSTWPHVSPLPRSLSNIFKEYQTDLGYREPRNGDLSAWAERGVLLLNTILTVEEGKPLSHAGIGWEKLAYEVVRSLGERGDVGFLLWGKKAAEYAAACGKCPIILSAHPSPFSADKGFFGSRPFTRVNEELRKMGVEPVDWRLS